MSPGLKYFSNSKDKKVHLIRGCKKFRMASEHVKNCLPKNPKFLIKNYGLCIQNYY